MIWSQDACVPCLKFRNSRGMKICGRMKPKAAPCGKLIFLLAVYGVVWYPDKPTLKETTHQNTYCRMCVAQQKSGKANKKKCASVFLFYYFLMVRHQLDNNTFCVQCSLNAVISHLRNTSQRPLATVLLIALLSGCQVHSLSWHVCSPLFIPACLCVPCECVYV